MLTVANIPDEYRKAETDGENIARLASGVQEAIRDAVGQPGLHALRRYVQAGFLFRSSEIGRAMIRRSAPLASQVLETPQLVNFAGGALTASALVGTVDLTAAAMYRLYFGPVDPSDEPHEADIGNFPGSDRLPDEARAWLSETRGAKGWKVLKGVRDQFVHRWFPLHITIVLGGGDGGDALHHLEIAGEHRSLSDFLDDSRAFVIDRLVAGGLIMLRYANSISR